MNKRYDTIPSLIKVMNKRKNEGKEEIERLYINVSCDIFPDKKHYCDYFDYDVYVKFKTNEKKHFLFRESDLTIAQFRRKLDETIKSKYKEVAI